MSEYTPEQIENARIEASELQTAGYEIEHIFPNRDFSHAELACILFAALEATEKERDALAAYAAKLEKTGDAVRHYKPDNNPLQAEVDIEDLFDAWDAARKAKP